MVIKAFGNPDSQVPDLQHHCLKWIRDYVRLRKFIFVSLVKFFFFLSFSLSPSLSSPPFSFYLLMTLHKTTVLALSEILLFVLLNFFMSQFYWSNALCMWHSHQTWCLINCKRPQMKVSMKLLRESVYNRYIFSIRLI